MCIYIWQIHFLVPLSDMIQTMLRRFHMDVQSSANDVDQDLQDISPRNSHKITVTVQLTKSMSFPNNLVNLWKFTCESVDMAVCPGTRDRLSETHTGFLLVCKFQHTIPTGIMSYVALEITLHNVLCVRVWPGTWIRRRTCWKDGDCYVTWSTSQATLSIGGTSE